MKLSYLVAACLVWVCMCAVLPAHAFTADTLTISVDGNGDAHAVMTYDLTLAEQAAIFFHAVNPATQLQTVISDNFAGQVTVLRADTSSAEVTISSFATVNHSGNTTTITTPAFSFENAQKIMEKYWFASLLSPHLNPQITTITFPDGYQATYNGQMSFPSVTHQYS